MDIITYFRIFLGERVSHYGANIVCSQELQRQVMFYPS